MNILVGIREEVARAGYRVEAQAPGTFGVATPRRIEYGQFCRYPACRGVLAWDSMRRRRHSNPAGRAPTLSNLGRPTRIAAFGKSVALGLAGTAAAAFVGLPDSLQDDSDAPAGTDPAPDSGRSDAHTGTRFERGNGAAQPIFDSWKLRAKRGQVVAVLVDGVELSRAEWEADGDRIYLQGPVAATTPCASVTAIVRRAGASNAVAAERPDPLTMQTRSGASALVTLG
jgi:hypothetical protein